MDYNCLLFTMSPVFSQQISIFSTLGWMSLLCFPTFATHGLQVPILLRSLFCLFSQHPYGTLDEFHCFVTTSYCMAQYNFLSYPLIYFTLCHLLTLVWWTPVFTRSTSAFHNSYCLDPLYLGEFLVFCNNPTLLLHGINPPTGQYSLTY